jgi:hypothetical protein
MSNTADFFLIAGSPPSEQDNHIPCFEKSNIDDQHLSLFLDNLQPYLGGGRIKWKKTRVICQFAAIKSGRYFLLNAALLLVYTVLLFLCKPRPRTRA